MFLVGNLNFNSRVMFKYFIHLFISLLLFSSIFSQKKINTHLIFPSNKIIESLKILFDNGKNEKSIDFQLIENNAFLSEVFFSEFGSLKISYTLSGGAPNNDLIFVNEKPSIIEYYQPVADTTKLNFKLVNGFDFTISKNKLLEYTKNEYIECKEFLEKYGKYFV